MVQASVLIQAFELVRTCVEAEACGMDQAFEEIRASWGVGERCCNDRLLGAGSNGSRLERNDHSGRDDPQHVRGNQETALDVEVESGSVQDAQVATGHGYDRGRVRGVDKYLRLVEVDVSGPCEELQMC